MKLLTRLVLLIALFAPSLRAGTTQWEIVPEANSQVPFGKIALVKGITAPEGVWFILKNLYISSPIELIVIAGDARFPVRLAVFKEGIDQPLAYGATDSSGVATLRFRTSEQVRFQVTGDPGVRYLLMTWVSPPINVGIPEGLVAVSQYPGAAQLASAQGAGAAGEIVGTQPARQPNLLSTWIVVLLGGILAALIAIVGLLWRSQRSRAKSGGIVVLLALGSYSVWAQEPKRMTTAAMKPEKASVSEYIYEKALSEFCAGLREKAEGWEKGGIKAEPEGFIENETGKLLTEVFGEGEGKADNGASTGLDLKKKAGSGVTGLKLLIDFLEEFKLIDPREAAVQPNYKPPGIPLLPSRCKNTDQCGACFAEAQAKLDRNRRLLETLYVIYKQNELQTGRIIELANAAAGTSDLAKIVWANAKANPNEPMNIAKQKFYNTYDADLGKLISKMNDALIATADCERDNFGDSDWYNRFGMPYYNFMRERYTRK
jgi:hypothetical protein